LNVSTPKFSRFDGIDFKSTKKFCGVNGRLLIGLKN